MKKITDIKKDFPFFENNNIIYLDNACTTLTPKQVITKVIEYYKEYPACHERSFHKLARKVKEEVLTAESNIKSFLNAPQSGILIFTKNCTEGINLVANATNFDKRNVVITTDKEHNSNFLPWRLLSQKKKIIHQIIKTNAFGDLDLKEFQSKVSRKTKLVSITHMSNIDGKFNDVKEIIKIAHEYGSYVLLDGAQSVAHTRIYLKSLDADFFVFSGHKMLGPKGIGCLYVKNQTILDDMTPFIVGGETVEDVSLGKIKFYKNKKRFEAGTQDAPGILGLSEAAKYLSTIGLEELNDYLISLNKPLVDFLSQDYKVLSGGSIVSFYSNTHKSEDIAMLFDQNNIATRCGLLCAHHWFNSHKVGSVVRVSSYLYNTKEDIKQLIKVLEDFK